MKSKAVITFFKRLLKISICCILGTIVDVVVIRICQHFGIYNHIIDFAVFAIVAVAIFYFIGNSSIRRN